MGAALGAQAIRHGARVLTLLDGRSAATARRARDAGMEPADDDAIARRADVLISLVPPGEALALAERLAPSLGRAARPPVYVDANAVSPATARRIAAAIGEGRPFADGCVIGLPPRPDGASPAIHVCGPAAPRLLPLRDLGFDIRLLPGPVGQASALKMCFGGITKGLSALGAAMKAAAAREGLGDVLDRELARSATGVAAFLDTTLPTVPAKAYRWVAEMDEVGAFLGDGTAGSIYGRIARYFEENG